MVIFNGNKQETDARILTLEEVIHIPIESDVWIQDKHYEDFVYAATYTGHGAYLNFYHSLLPKSEYRKQFVCWNKRPTKEQTKEVEWL